jgi:hypothetical protein
LLAALKRCCFPGVTVDIDMATFWREIGFTFAPTTV